MDDLYFCLGALVLFTVGFLLVKRGNPFKYGGGDSYTTRRMFRMLGWMMWLTAAVMVVLTLTKELSGEKIADDQAVPQSSGHPDAAQLPLVTRTSQLIPNLIHTPSLQADTSVSNVPSAPGASDKLTLASIVPHQVTIAPTMINPSPNPGQQVLPAIALPDDTSDKTDTASAPAPAPEAVSPPPVLPPTANAPLDPTKVKQLDAEIAAADAIVKKDPNNLVGYLQRGTAYANERRWDLARADYQQALQIDSKCSIAQLNLAEIDFLQGQYDAARPGFLVLVNNPDLGDLAKYKVFLCDLLSGHEQVAAKELAVFNEVGSEASYYFANVAWSAYHKKKDDAQSWLDSAKSIFAPDKVTLYAQPLVDLGMISLAS